MSEKPGYTINDLRGDLADTIRQLRNGDKDMTIEKAKAIGDIAQTMINSAKVEVDMARALGTKNMRPTGFMALEGPAEPECPPLEGRTAARPAIERDTSPAYGTPGRAPQANL